MSQSSGTARNSMESSDSRGDNAPGSDTKQRAMELLGHLPYNADEVHPDMHGLWQLINDRQSHQWLFWSADGLAFLVKYSKEFERSRLRFYFRKATVRSFVRKLEAFQFKRVEFSAGEQPEGDWVKLMHPNFQREQPSLLRDIQVSEVTHSPVWRVTSAQDMERALSDKANRVAKRTHAASLQQRTPPAAHKRSNSQQQPQQHQNVPYQHDSQLTLVNMDDGLPWKRQRTVIMSMGPFDTESSCTSLASPVVSTATPAGVSSNAFGTACGVPLSRDPSLPAATTSATSLSSSRPSYLPPPSSSTPLRSTRLQPRSSTSSTGHMASTASLSPHEPQQTYSSLASGRTINSAETSQSSLYSLLESSSASSLYSIPPSCTAAVQPACSTTAITEGAGGGNTYLSPSHFSCAPCPYPSQQDILFFAPCPAQQPFSSHFTPTPWTPQQQARH